MSATVHTYILAIDRDSCEWACQTNEGCDVVMPLIFAYQPEDALTRDYRGVVYRREVYPEYMTHGITSFKELEELGEFFLEDPTDSR